MTELAILLPLVAFVALAAGDRDRPAARRPDRGPHPRGGGLPVVRARPRGTRGHVARGCDEPDRCGPPRPGRAPTPSARRSPRRPTPWSATSRRRGPSTGRAAAIEIRDDIVAELERAERALAMVDHGADDPRPGPSPRPRAGGARRRSSAGTSTCSTPARPSTATRRAPDPGRRARAVAVNQSITVRGPLLTTPSSGILAPHHKW